MGLQAWWLQSRLNRVEAKLKRQRSRLKHLRNDAEALAKERKKGGNPAQLDQKEQKLQAERDGVTQDIARLVEEEQQLRRELSEARGEVPAAS